MLIARKDFVRTARSSIRVCALASLFWLLCGVSYSQSSNPYVVFRASTSNVAWTGEAATYEEAANEVVKLYSNSCFSDGRGGCLPLQVGTCTPSGAPTDSVLTACTAVLPGGGWIGIQMLSRQAPEGFSVTATPPAKGSICTGDCAGSDPINPSLGNMYDQTRDVAVANPGTIEFVRFYNSAESSGTDMGPGWHHSYGQSIVANYNASKASVYSGRIALVSAQYPDPATACVSGFADIKSAVSAWASASATYVDNTCVLSGGGHTIGTLQVNSKTPTAARASVAEYDVIRDDGQILRYTLQGGILNAPPGVSLHLAVTSTGFTLTDEQDNVETYNSAGVLQTITSRSGVIQTLSYDSGGRLSSVEDSFGNALMISRNASNQIASVALNGGTPTSYGYDATLHLTQVTNADLTTHKYSYGATGFPAALIQVIDENNSTYATWTYDAQGRATFSSLAGGAAATSLVYNDENSVLVTDALGASRTVSFTRSGDQKPVIGISGSHCLGCVDWLATSYDTAGWAASRTDYNGNLTCYSNDLARGLELVRVEGFSPGSTCPANPATYTPAAGTTQRKISTTWSSVFRLPTLITEATRTTSLGYDTFGNLLTRTVTDTTVTPNVSRTWTYTYNGFGQVLTVHGPRTDANNTTTFTYYSCTSGAPCGQVQTITDAVGHEWTYNTYNVYGQPLTITDPNGVVTTLTYDVRQHMTSRSASGETTSFSYYPTGLLKTVTLPDNSTLTYTYDAAHRLTQISDGLGNKVVYTLDAMGNRTSEKTYNPSGTLHRTHTRAYNARNELYQDVNAANTAAVTTTYGYDFNGNQISAAAPLSRNSVNGYDALNRLQQITDPANGITDFAYDVNDNLVSVTDPRTLVTSYSYNGFGELTTQISPDTSSTTNTYDSAGNLATSTDARGAVSAYTYDALNRLISVAYSLDGSTDQTMSFTYDSGVKGSGHLTGASDASHSLSWGYDSLGRVTSKSQTVNGVTKSVGYVYTFGDLTSLITPSGQTVTYSYNATHQIRGVAVNGATVLNAVTYEPLGPANGWTWGNAVTTSRTYNSDGAISQISSNGVKTYTYDDALRIAGISDTSVGSSSWRYGYDALDRLTSGMNATITRGWTYDANGNRLSETGTSPSTYTISPTSNQITGITGALARTYDYDAAGNTTIYSSTTSTYNDAGRLKTVSNGSVTETLIYNALGQRIETSGGGAGTVLYWYDEQGHLLGEYDGSGNLVEETVWLGDIPVATLRPNGSAVAIYYVHTDQLNTPRAVTRPADNALMWSWFSDPFGTDAANENPAGAGTFKYNLRFPGQIFDGQAGLHLNGFRDFDPATGRYIESDPIGLVGGTNTYAYVGDAPLVLADALGLCPDDKKEDCEKKLADMLNDIQAVRGDHASGFKGLAQRFRQLGRQLPDKVRQGYIEQFKNRQKSLQEKIEDYINSGCGDPPPLVTQWANKEVPALPPSKADFIQNMSEVTGLTGGALARYLIISEGSRLFLPRNLVPVP